MSSSSSSVSATTVNGRSVISGLSSGVDVDGLVKTLIDSDSATINKLKQQQQTDTWKQEQYRSIISDLQSFTNKYLDLTSTDSILSQSAFQQFNSTSDNTAVSVSASTSAVKGTHTITVSQLATAATQASAAGMTKDVAGDAASTADYTSLKGTSFTINVDGTSRTVTFKDISAYDNPSSITDVVSYTQAAINEAIGTTTNSGGDTINKVTVSLDSSGFLTFAPTDDSGVGSITISSATGNDALSSLGFGSNANLSNRISTSDTLATVAGKLKSADAFAFDATSGDISFTINGKSFTFDQTDTLSDMIDTVNKDTDANVTMKYDQNTDQLVITANELGAGNTLQISDTAGNFVSKVLTVSTAGKDAKIVLDGQTLTRSSNSITQDGITYTLNDVTTGKATVNVSQDTDGIYTKISNFVDAYNTLIDKLNAKISETHDNDYPPLTDAQESSMSDSEITKWNQKAQTGLLQNDSVIQSLLTNMRQALMSSVSGVTENLTKIGITTGTYTEKGKLYIDKAKLTAAISSDPQGVMNLFTQKSTSYSGLSTVRTLNSSQRAIRTGEEGLAYKLYDILQDNIGTIRNSGGYKGSLLEKAGITNDSSETSNTLTDELDSLADKIKAEQKRLDDEKDRYYTQFTNMETALSKLSSQSSILSSYLSS